MMYCSINFTEARPSKNGELTAFPIIIENGIEIGTFRQYHKSGNWGAILVHNHQASFSGKNVNDKDNAIKILTRRLEKHGVKLIDDLSDYKVGECVEILRGDDWVEAIVSQGGKLPIVQLAGGTKKITIRSTAKIRRQEYKEAGIINHIKPVHDADLDAMDNWRNRNV